MMTPQVRTGLTHAGTALGGAIAATSFLSSQSVDLYAIWNQLNDVIAGVGKLIALITPVATGAYGVYKASTAQKMKDIMTDPVEAVKAAESMPVTLASVAVAEALTTDGKS